MRRRSRGVSSASRSNARRVSLCGRCLPGASDASGALMRITSYGFGGFTARYRLSFFFFFSVAGVAGLASPFVTPLIDAA